MRNIIGLYSSRALLGPALGASCLLAGETGCSAGRSPDEEAATQTEVLGVAEAALHAAYAPGALAFALDLNGQQVELSLERLSPPTASDYRTFRRTITGELEVLEPADLGCFYRGTASVVGSADTGFASMSSCADVTGNASGHAVSGVLRVGGQLWSLTPDPLDGDESDGVNHFAQRMGRPDASGHVADEVRRVTLRRLPESRISRLAFREGTDKETKYIDLVVVNDAARVAALGASTEATTVQFVDTMNALLEGSGLTPRLRVTLRAQVLFDQDPYIPTQVDGEVDHNSLLDAFLDWGGTEDLPDHDEHMLLSGYDFVGGVVGFAGLNVACSTNNNGFIVQAGRASSGFAVLSAVHELGHTLGMGHDEGPNCPNVPGFIMAAVGCGNCPVDGAQFSPCSIEQFQNFLAGPSYGTRCADDVPVGTVANCGDGAVQAGETCDCGSTDCSSIDPCCNGATCQLQAGAECSDFNDGCCQDCTIVDADEAVVCRAARSSCDLAESCNGISKDCPPDSFQPAGEECEDDRGNAGACYFADCRARGTQCELFAEQQNNPQFNDLGSPGPNCGAPCNVTVCGLGPNGCVQINGLDVVDGVTCNDGGQCVNGQCLPAVDQCPDDPEKDDPGYCGCGEADADRDSDGAPDCVDQCPNDPEKRSAGQCGCDVPDTDTDGDKAPDCEDECPTDAAKSAPGDCGCGQPDVDTDADGAADCIDQCPNHPDQRTPGACGCGVSEVDTDADGTPDCIDGCNTDPTRVMPPCQVEGGTDTNGDGIVDVRGSASVRSKGSCAIGAMGERKSGRALRTVGVLSLLALPLWRRRRRRLLTVADRGRSRGARAEGC